MVVYVSLSAPLIFWTWVYYLALKRPSVLVFSEALNFGAVLSCRVDAIIYSKNIKGESIPFTHYIPGLVATLALIFMNLISREELAELSDSYSGDDEGAEVDILLC